MDVTILKRSNHRCFHSLVFGGEKATVCAYSLYYLRSSFVLDTPEVYVHDACIQY